MKYGLIGEKLGHSFSREIHNKIADYQYDLAEIPQRDLDSFIEKRDFLGINVTIPYKERVMKSLDFIDESAKEIGAVNTVVKRDGKLYGYNTDYMGAKALIEFADIEIRGKKVLILGAGGTSKTLRKVVSDMGAERIKTVSRREQEGCVTYAQAVEEFSDSEVVVNTTPVGMFPNSDHSPISLTPFKNLEGVVDVIYNPLRTPLVREAKALGRKAVGGLYMLVAQAVFASALFRGVEVDETLIKSVYKSVISEKENIVLIGMPGSGKSTVGKVLAKKTDREFFDSDVKIVQTRLTSIKEIFASVGEGGFRKYETEAIKDLSNLQNSVIATGGGAVLKEENMDLLRANGKIFFLDRPLEDLTATKDRPLSSNKKDMEKRFAERYGKYLFAADVRVEAGTGVNDVAEKVLKEFLK